MLKYNTFSADIVANISHGTLSSDYGQQLALKITPLLGGGTCTRFFQLLELTELTDLIYHNILARCTAYDLAMYQRWIYKE